MLLFVALCPSYQAAHRYPHVSCGGSCWSSCCACWTGLVHAGALAVDHWRASLELPTLHVSCLVHAGAHAVYHWRASFQPPTLYGQVQLAMHQQSLRFASCPRLLCTSSSPSPAPTVMQGSLHVPEHA